MSRRPRSALEREVHAGSLELMAGLDEMQPQDAFFDNCVAQLGARLLPGLDAERVELFPRLHNSGFDLGGVGLQMAARRRALQADITRMSVAVTARWHDARLAA